MENKTPLSVQTSQVDPKLSEHIADKLRKYLRGQRAWSLAAHGSTILVVTFSSIAAVLAKSNITLPFAIDATTCSTIFSLLVTILAAVKAQIGFERKWLANRMSRSALEQLQVDEEAGMTQAELVKQLKAIIAAHDRAITTST